MGVIADILEQKLQAAFAPCQLLIMDESARHAGHAGARPEGETHFTVTLKSARFQGMDRLARARLVHETLGADLMMRIHALSLKLDILDEGGNYKV